MQQIVMNVVKYYGSYKGKSKSGENEVYKWAKNEKEFSPHCFIKKDACFRLVFFYIEAEQDCEIEINNNKNIKLTAGIEELVCLGKESIIEEVKFNKDIKYIVKYTYIPFGARK